MGPRIMRERTDNMSFRAQERQDMKGYKTAIGHDTVVCVSFVAFVLFCFSIVNQQVKVEVNLF
jgi:hypothetical protein